MLDKPTAKQLERIIARGVAAGILTVFVLWILLVVGCAILASLAGGRGLGLWPLG